ncbi:hypothetical protein [Candidatus Clostridium radicumherbarum]|uniref:Uncharacterized protein n=1 Tax=Candidatus Clostridium radicumherbarum TaxID=3381662 RepID=A0ABW8TPL5_9CLOT
MRNKGGTRINNLCVQVKVLNGLLRAVCEWNEQVQTAQYRGIQEGFK